MKTKLERFAIGLILAPVLPLVGLMCSWWSAYALLPEKWIPICVIAGLLAGILADVFLLKRLLDRRLGWPFWVAVFLFYSIGIFGMVMGVKSRPATGTKSFTAHSLVHHRRAGFYLCLICLHRTGQFIHCQ
jgi:hypothetical protein